MHFVLYKARVLKNGSIGPAVSHLQHINETGIWRFRAHFVLYKGCVLKNGSLGPAVKI